MDENTFDDIDMECDFINRPRTPCGVIEAEHDTERPTTPPNNMSIVSSDFCSTPSLNVQNDSEPSFIRRVGLDRLNRDRCTSTPLFKPSLKSVTHSVTLPHTITSRRPHLIELRQCRSAENITRPITCDPDSIPYEYMNPFTPDAKQLNKSNGQKQSKRLTVSSVQTFDLNDNSDGDLLSNTDSEIDVPSRPRLSEFNVSRFYEEFFQLKQIGKGAHGCVYKCLNRMNGCIYAIKKTIKPIRSSIQERIIRNEIFAHGVLDHPNIVRNYSCWKEEGFVFIQNEFCDGGSLEDYIKTNVMTETLLHSLLFQMAHALRFIHKKGLAHMDIKPGNILLCINRMNKENSIDSDGGFSDDDKPDEIVFKLGDLGHITKLDEKHDVEEGDCRYLPREILEEKFQYLDRADIFALGLTIYEAAGGGPLPKNGDEWQDIRNGNLKHLEQHSKAFNDLLKVMIQPSPAKRPSAAELVTMVQTNASSPPTDDMFEYLRQYRHNTVLLEHKVETAGHFLRALFKSHKQLQEKIGKGGTPGKEKLSSGKKKGGVTKARVVGKKTNRSSSTTTF